MGTLDYVIAVDPGKMTGWAQLAEGEFKSGEAPLDEYLHWVNKTIVETGLRPVIVCEDFIYTPQTAKKSRQTWSTEAIGVLRFLAREYGCDFNLQTPSEAKSFATDEKLKKVGWHVPGKGHANDAARHLMVHAVRVGLLNPRELI